MTLSRFFFLPLAGAVLLFSSCLTPEDQERLEAEGRPAESSLPASSGDLLLLEKQLSRTKTDCAETVSANSTNPTLDNQTGTFVVDRCEDSASIKGWKYTPRWIGRSSLPGWKVVKTRDSKGQKIKLIENSPTQTDATFYWTLEKEFQIAKQVKKEKKNPSTPVDNSTPYDGNSFTSTASSTPPAEFPVRGRTLVFPIQLPIVLINLPIPPAGFKRCIRFQNEKNQKRNGKNGRKSNRGIGSWSLTTPSQGVRPTRERMNTSRSRSTEPP